MLDFLFGKQSSDDDLSSGYFSINNVNSRRNSESMDEPSNIQSMSKTHVKESSNSDLNSSLAVKNLTLLELLTLPENNGKSLAFKSDNKRWYIMDSGNILLQQSPFDVSREHKRKSIIDINVLNFDHISLRLVDNKLKMTDYTTTTTHSYELVDFKELCIPNLCSLSENKTKTLSIDMGLGTTCMVTDMGRTLSVYNKKAGVVTESYMGFKTRNHMQYYMANGHILDFLVVGSEIYFRNKIGSVLRDYQFIDAQVK